MALAGLFIIISGPEIGVLVVNLNSISRLASGLGHSVQVVVALPSSCHLQVPLLYGNTIDILNTSKLVVVSNHLINNFPLDNGMKDSGVVKVNTVPANS